jgi:hypothetical protein
LLSLPSATEAILHPSQIPHALEMVNTPTIILLIVGYRSVVEARHRAS